MNPLARCLTLLLALALAGAATGEPRAASPRWSPQQLAGTWYELAAANDGASGCASDVIDRYRPQRDGTLALERSCRTPTGRLQTEQGRAWFASEAGDDSARITVSFLPRWLQWLPLRRGDRRIVMLDAERRYAVLAGSGGRGLWLLSRLPALPPALLRGIVDRLTREGYPTGELVLTHQSGADGQLGGERPFYPHRPALVVWHGLRKVAARPRATRSTPIPEEPA